MNELYEQIADLREQLGIAWEQRKAAVTAYDEAEQRAERAEAERDAAIEDRERAERQRDEWKARADKAYEDGWDAHIADVAIREELGGGDE